MNKKFKKFVSLSVACLIWLFAVPYTQANASIISNIKNAFTSSKESDDQTEGGFNFIKSNESSNDFFYDGSLLLYGGIAFISISIIGIIITLKPKKKKKKKRKNIVSRKPKR